MLLEAALSAETDNTAALAFSRRLGNKVMIKLVAEFADYFPTGGYRRVRLKNVFVTFREQKLALHFISFQPS